MFFDNKNFMLRKEFFGGLLVDKRNLVRYEINQYDYVFLNEFLRSNSNIQTVINNINNSLDIDYIPDINQFLEIGVLIGETDGMGMGEELSPIEINHIDKNYLSYPIEISIYPSLKCNLKCNFCFLGFKLNQNYNEKNAEEWFTLINDAVKSGCLSVSILGGEPLLYFDILNLLKMLENAKIRTSITSNGLCWKKCVLDFIKTSKYITPIFSIQSFSERNKEYMGKSHDMEKWKTTVYEITKFKKIRINSVYLDQSIEELKQIIDFGYNNNVEKFSLAYKYDVNSDWTSFKEIIYVQDCLEKYIESNNYENFHFSVEGCMIYSVYEDLDGSVVNTPYQQLTYGCEAGNSRLEIVPNGDSYPCISFFEKDMSCGNVFESSLRNIWDSSTLLKELRNGKTTDEKCLSCTCNNFCNGGCPTINLVRNGKMFGKGDPRCLLKQTN
ncbi:radical SAM protein [Enterococcus sp. AZ050]|uniref:radical SAM protein n=1 Tax=Enterococcus sp. AZ050 TaxID=2774696 RepID=UPI003F274F45